MGKWKQASTVRRNPPLQATFEGRLSGGSSISDEQMAIDHKWERERGNYPTAPDRFRYVHGITVYDAFSNPKRIESTISK